jgi:hypothetical protein
VSTWFVVPEKIAPTSERVKTQEIGALFEQVAKLILSTK